MSVSIQITLSTVQFLQTHPYTKCTPSKSGRDSVITSEESTTKDSAIVNPSNLINVSVPVFIPSPRPTTHKSS